MLRVLSDLTITNRVDIPAASSTTYYQGDFVNPAGAKTGSKGDWVPLGCVFNMTDANNVGTTNLSVDTTTITYNSTQSASIGGSETLTVIAGPFRGVTDKITTVYGTPSAGDGLTVVSGLLAKATIGTDHVVAVLESAAFAYEHRGTSYASGAVWRFKAL